MNERVVEALGRLRQFAAEELAVRRQSYLGGGDLTADEAMCIEDAENAMKDVDALEREFHSLWELTLMLKREGNGKL
jgi:hypothetical protein